MQKFITKYQNTEFNSILKELFTMGPVGFILVMQRWFNIHKSIKGMDHINRMKNKSHQIFSIDSEKVNILSRQKLKMQKAGISKSQDRYDKLLTNRILNSKMWSVFAPIRNKNKMLTLTTSKQLVQKSQKGHLGDRKKYNTSKLERKKIRCPCLQKIWFIYRNFASKKVFELISESSTLADTKVNIQQSEVLIY